MDEVILTTLEDLKKRGVIYIESLGEKEFKEGFHILEGAQEQYESFLTEWIRYNGIENSYADFYVSRIQGEAKKVLYEPCTSKQRGTLDSLLEAGEGREVLFVQLSPSILECLLSVSYQESLFSTFYFTKEIATIWSNYNGRFLCFVREKETADKIRILANKSGLKME